MSTYLETAIDDMVSHSEPLPPALLPYEENLKAKMTEAVQNGLEADKVMKMTFIISICIKRGLPLEDIQTHQNLFTRLMMESNFSTTDANINRMINMIQLAVRDA